MRESEITRRRFLATTAGTLTAVGAAGCTDVEGGPGNDTSNDDTDSYTVSMEPVGDVTFDSVPKQWSTYFPGYADMGVALGLGDDLTAIGNAARYYTTYYDELDGVSVNNDLTELIGDSGIDKELYYGLENDVHLTDPEWLISNSFFGLQEDDIDELTQNVAPFIGNTIFRRTDGWHDYPYYTMYEAFEKIAQVFQREDRYQAFADFHDDMISSVESSLPAADSRPNGLLCYAASNEPKTFSPYRLGGDGTNKKHFHDLGVTDALEGSDVEGLSESNRSEIDYETMLDVDPDNIFIRGHETKTRSEFEETVVAHMQNHNVASELTAVQNDAVYRGGPIYQGPIQNLFLTERFATLLYPDSFQGELFDRSELASIITGDE